MRQIKPITNLMHSDTMKRDEKIPNLSVRNLKEQNRAAKIYLKDCILCISLP